MKKQPGFPNLTIGNNGKKLTLKQTIAVSEYLKTGKKSTSYLAAYSGNKKNIGAKANTLFRRPKIVSAIAKALKDKHFDDAYGVDKLKRIVEGGMGNIEITRPDTALKALETFWKLTGKLGSGPNMGVIKPDPEQQAKKMDMTELQNVIKELDKKQKRILAIISGTPIEGVIVK